MFTCSFAKRLDAENMSAFIAPCLLDDLFVDSFYAQNLLGSIYGTLTRLTRTSSVLNTISRHD
jgi:hypothetical protein